MYHGKDFNRIFKSEFEGSLLGEEEYRSAFWRDYARIIHSPSFRRLQGKTQLFPGADSDFFRNRLTHSLEVAQIAKSIANRINARYYFDRAKKNPINIDPDLVSLAGLAHDIGHPPFGHQGEQALDQCMYNCGGFESNAQTLRIVARIEKKFKERFGFANRVDTRVGINLTYRSLASILKYDTVIPPNEQSRRGFESHFNLPERSLVKGYYLTEQDYVNEIKGNVLRNKQSKSQPFHSIECNIMDIADDIAYSIYDLEDGLKAGFYRPYDIVFAPRKKISEVARRVSKNVGFTVSSNDVYETLYEIFKEIFTPLLDSSKSIYGTGVSYSTSKKFAEDGYLRCWFTSNFVGTCIRGIEFELNPSEPVLSSVSLNDEIRVKVEVLKYLNYELQINSNKLKLVEFRGQEIIRTIFEVLSNSATDGFRLMPEDYQDLYEIAPSEEKKRVVCDFIAGMTDNYCVEFYARLKSEKARSIFNPI